jgi:hypothetical protein
MTKEEPMTDDDGSTEEGQEATAELFEHGSLQGEGVTPQSRVPKGANPMLRAVMGQAEVPLRDGLRNPNRIGRALVTFRVRGDKTVYLHDDSDDPTKITGHKIVQQLDALYVDSADDSAALVRREFADLLGADASAAGDLLRELSQQAAEVGAVKAGTVA